MGIRANPPGVSVVVNTYNRAASLQQTLQAMRRQNYSNFEVIVVNGPSTDQTIDVLRGHASEIRVGSCSERNLSISRNVGIEMARGTKQPGLRDYLVWGSGFILTTCTTYLLGRLAKRILAEVEGEMESQT